MTIVTLATGFYTEAEVANQVFLQAWVDVLMDAAIATLPNPYFKGERYLNSSPRPGEPLGWVFNGKEWTPFGVVK